ncbi:MAG TPA: DivIVA domain-containing protein [Acidimicrobiales bacterium]|nr:DivIVA domain-containing protein [Acidimicrobiales bacterium]
MPPEPSPLDATGIARRHFSTVRRGYDPTEVRAFLHDLSEVVGRLQRNEAHQLDRAERAEARAQLAEQLDEHRLVELLGAETARVLEAAREAAGDIRAKAEESAGRMIRDAQGEAHTVLEQAERDAADRRREIVSEAEQLHRDAEAILERRRAEGQELAGEIRRAAEVERERMLAEGQQARAGAEADADRLRDTAREQGRQLVAEAQAVRERMLGDLARRRRTAKEQLERLNAARERLLAAYAVVRRTVDEATGELTVALPQAKLASESAARRVSEAPEPSVDELEAELTVARMAGLVEDLDGLDDVDVDEIDALIDGRLEAADHQLADQEAGLPRRTAGGDAGERKSIWPFRRRPADEPPTEPEPSEASATVAEALEAAAIVTEVADRPVERGRGVDDDLDDGERDSEVDAVGGDAPYAAGDHPPEADTGVRDTGDAGVGVRDTGDADVGDLEAADPVTDRPGGIAAAGDDHDQVEELFARLKADRGAPSSGAADGNETLGVGATAVAVIDDPQDSADVAVAAGGEDGGAEADELDPDAAVLHDRDTHLGPVERELGRRLKRVLADEQNEVFDLLRRDHPASVDDVVPAAAEHAQRYAAAALPELDVAAVSGAASVHREVRGSCTALANELGQSLVEPMRERIARAFDECDGDLEEVTERLRSLYREWKGQRIGAAVRHYAAAAYAWGVYEATPSDAELRWLVDRAGEACPDADDNALASGVRKGEAFPTGVLCSPAHPDCRCLVVPVGMGGGSGGPGEARSGRAG